jgi:hypothetical protein
MFPIPIPTPARAMVEIAAPISFAATIILEEKFMVTYTKNLNILG